ncbi:MAG: hypothetical protein QXY55_05680 [Candidatus Korarchaeota archaeon]
MSLDEYIDPFAFHTVGLSQIYYREGKYFPRPITESSGWQSTANEISIRFVPTLFLLVLSQITGISLWHLLFLPIIGIIMPLFAYLICRNLRLPVTTAILYAMVISYNLFMVNVYYISVGMFFFMVFIYISLKFLESRQSIKGTDTGLLILIFIIAYFSYYTSEFLILGYILSITLLIWTREKFGVKNLKVKYYYLLSLIFLIVFSGFDNVFYWYFENVNIEKGLDLFNSYVNYVLSLLKSGGETVFEYRPQIGNPLIVYIEFIQQILIWVTIGIYLTYSIARIKDVRKMPAAPSIEGLVFIALFLTGIMETLIYLPVGYGVYTRTLSIFSSLGALYSLDKLGAMFRMQRKRILKIVFIVVALLIVSASFAKFAIRVSDPVNPNGARLHSKINVTISWILSYSTDKMVVADLRTIGQLFFELTQVEKINSIILRRLGPEVRYLYSLSNEGNDEISKLFGRRDALLVLSHEFRERAFIAGEAWRFSPPIREAFSILSYQGQVNKIFDDGRGLIYEYS